MRYALPTLRKVGKPFGQSHSDGPRTKGAEDGHQGEILCLAASEDGKYLVSGGRDRVVGIWNVEQEEPKWITGMRGHKDAVTVGQRLDFADERPFPCHHSIIHHIIS